MRPKTLTWMGGEHAFRLGLEHLRALERHCDAGPEQILSRLMAKAWRLADVVDTIRLGLEGGGMPKDEARRLVECHLDGGAIAAGVETAVAILAIRLWGEPEAEPKEGDDAVDQV